MPGPTRPTGRGPEIVEIQPTHCLNGHPLTPGHMLVGSSPCSCGTHHRTYRCDTPDCAAVLTVPPQDLLGAHRPLVISQRGRLSTRPTGHP